MGRESRIILLSGKPLLLSRCHDATVIDERSCAIVIEGRNAQDLHDYVLAKASPNLERHLKTRRK